MSLCKFLQFNQVCPICEEPLTLYMQWHNSTLWKGEAIGVNEYRFDQFKFPNKELGKNAEFSLFHDEDKFNIVANDKVLQVAAKQSLHFFFVCNKNGFEDRGTGDYELNLYHACYFRSSADMEFKQTPDKTWSLDSFQVNGNDLVSQEESFAFKKSLEPDLERVYLLSLKHGEDSTELWFYETNAAQRADDNFEPKLFEKKMPLLKVRPKLSPKSRDKLLSRFDSWILMS